MKHTFPGEEAADIMGVLKRSVTVIFGKQAIYCYLRVPSEHEAAGIHRIVKDDIHKDFLVDDGKPLYAAYKKGHKGNYASTYQ